MGACFGHCISKVTDSLSYRFYQRHTSMSYQGDEQVEFIDDKGDADQPRGSKTLLSFLSLNRFKKKHRVPVTLELLEDGAWSKDTNKYARLNSRNDASTSSGLDIPLQILDARTLMKQQTCISSTPGSSLDLEWEHEGMPLPVIDDEKVESTDGSITQTSVNNSQPSSLTASPWSRVSTPNSLEWDPVEADMTVILARCHHLAAGSDLLSYHVFSPIFLPPKYFATGPSSPNVTSINSSFTVACFSSRYPLVLLRFS